MTAFLHKGKLLHRCSPATVNEWLPRRVRVLGTSHVATLDDRSRRRPAVEVSWQSNIVEKGSHRFVTLNSMGCRTGSQWSCIKTGVMCSRRRVPVTRCAAAFVRPEDAGADCQRCRTAASYSSQDVKWWMHEPLSSRLRLIALVWQIGAAVSIHVPVGDTPKILHAYRHTALICADMVGWLSTITPRSHAVSTVVADDDRMVISRTVTLSVCCCEPSQMTSVLAGLRHSRLALSHSTTSAMHRVSWSAANWASTTGMLRYKY